MNTNKSKTKPEQPQLTTLRDFPHLPPAPWETFGSATGKREIFGIRNSVFDAPNPSDYFTFFTETEAIASAFGALPELIEACTFALSVIRSQGLFELSERIAVDKLEGALEKAKGKS